MYSCIANAASNSVYCKYNDVGCKEIERYAAETFSVRRGKEIQFFNSDKFDCPICWPLVPKEDYAIGLIITKEGYVTISQKGTEVHDMWTDMKNKNHCFGSDDSSLDIINELDYDAN